MQVYFFLSHNWLFTVGQAIPKCDINVNFID
jgi:hypothetical protein